MSNLTNANYSQEMPPMADVEDVLLRRFVETGDAAPFAEIIQQHAGLVYAACLRILGDQESAADAVQETFLQLLRNAGNITVSLPSWLHRVATRKAIDRARAETRRKNREAEYLARKQPEPAKWQDVSWCVDEALDELNEEMRDILTLYFFQGRSMADIAKAKGVSHPTICRRIQSGVEKMRAKIKKRGIIIGVAALTAFLEQNAVLAATPSLLKELGKIAIVGAAEGTQAAVTATASAVATGGAAGALKVKIVTAILAIALGTGALTVYTQTSQQQQTSANVPQIQFDRGLSSLSPDVASIIKRIRKARRPAQNMRIEWTAQWSVLNVWGYGSSRKRIHLSKYKGSAILSGTRSRILERQDTYYTDDINEPGVIGENTYVFNGTVRREMHRTIKGTLPPNYAGHGAIMIDDVGFILIPQRLFGGYLIDSERLSEDFEWTVADTNAPNIVILEATNPESRQRFTVDGNRGYNIVKAELFSSAGKYREHNFKLKRHPNGVWFVSEREALAYRKGRTVLETPYVESRATITSVLFDTPAPDDKTFTLKYPDRAKLSEMTFDYEDSFTVDSLTGPSHTKEKPSVTAILDNRTTEDYTSGNSTRSHTFGPLVERSINSVTQRSRCFIDFDTGKLLSITPDFHKMDSETRRKWLSENGVDARFEADEGLAGLWTFNTRVIPVSNNRWAAISPQQCLKVLDNVKSIQPPIMSTQSQLPATFLFRTFENNGIIQITEVDTRSEHKCIKVRYKVF